MRRLVILLCLCLPPIMAARAEPTAAPLEPPGQMCRAAIAAAEQAGGIPAQLMAAIGRVESGRIDPATGRMQPWPWTINADGQGRYFDTRAQAIAAVRALQARGVRSIDVGCMQVNLMHHPDAFASLDAAFDPATNAAYAAKFLNELHAQGGDWSRAVGLYHSATPDLGAAYQRSVMAVWPEERRLAGGVPALALNAPPHPVLLPPGGGAIARGSLPMIAPRGNAVMGRDLAAYRATPILSAVRPPHDIPRNPG